MPERRYARGCGQHCAECWRNRLKHASRRRATSWLVFGVETPRCGSRSGRYFTDGEFSDRHASVPEYDERVPQLLNRQYLECAEQVLAELPARARRLAGVLARPNECPICLCDMRRVGKPLACGHWAHRQCMQRMRDAAGGHSSCPLCRQALDRPRVVEAVTRAFLLARIGVLIGWTREDVEHGSSPEQLADDEYCLRRFARARAHAERELADFVNVGRHHRALNLRE
jgi:hypothetical protein